MKPIYHKTLFSRLPPSQLQTLKHLVLFVQRNYSQSYVAKLKSKLKIHISPKKNYVNNAPMNVINQEVHISHVFLFPEKRCSNGRISCELT